MSSSVGADWLIPGALIILNVVPVSAGTYRLLQIVARSDVAPDILAVAGLPEGLILHIAGTSLFCVLGALQFSPGLRRVAPRWHRSAGRLVVASGLAAAASGLWLTFAYPPGEGDSLGLSIVRFAVGLAMMTFILLSMAAIRRRDIARHRAWMIRAFALGLGAGTQILVHIPLMLFADPRDELARALIFTAGWGINLGIAEWIIRRTGTFANVPSAWPGAHANSSSTA